MLFFTTIHTKLTTTQQENHQNTTTHTTTPTTKKSEIKERVKNQNHKQILLQKFQYIHFKEIEICSKQFIELHTNLVKLREGGRESDRKLQGKRDDDETEARSRR